MSITLLIFGGRYPTIPTIRIHIGRSAGIWPLMSKGLPVDIGDVSRYQVRITKCESRELKRPVSLSLRDFPSDEIEHGRELRDFGIAFNYIGPIADPLGRHSPLRRR